MALRPQIPVVNAGFLYIDGLEISNSLTVPATFLSIAAGAARDSTNTNDIILEDDVELNLAARGALGIDTGAVAANTMYAVYVIASSANPVNFSNLVSEYPVTVILSTDFEAPFMPANYDMFRRIGAVVTDGASHFVPFYQTGHDSARKIWYSLPRATSIVAGAATAYTAVGLNAVAPSVPNLEGITVFIRAALTPAAAANKVFLHPVANATANIASDVASGSVAAVAQTVSMSCPIAITADVANIFYKVSAAGDAVALPVVGYIDVL